MITLGGLEYIEATKSLIETIITAQERYERLKNIVTDAPKFRQRLSQLEKNLKDVERIYGQSPDIIINTEPDLRNRLQREIRNCRDAMSKINELLIFILEQPIKPQQLYQASVTRSSLVKYHDDLDRERNNLNETKDDIRAALLKCVFSYVFVREARMNWRIGFDQSYASSTWGNTPNSTPTIEIHQFFWPLVRRCRLVGMRRIARVTGHDVLTLQKECSWWTFSWSMTACKVVAKALIQREAIPIITLISSPVFIYYLSPINLISCLSVYPSLLSKLHVLQNLGCKLPTKID